MIQSVSRAIDILELFSESGRRLRLSEIADLVGLKHNTTHNLLQTLVARGYVEKVEGPAYTLGQAALELARAGGTNTFVDKAADTVLSLHRNHPEATIVLTERIGGSIVVRLRISPERPGVLQKPHGMVFSPYSTAGGLALLAFLPEEENMKLREQHPFYEYGAHLWQTPEKLNFFLSEAREKGFIVPPFKGQESFRVAAPVDERWGNACFALGASLSEAPEIAGKDCLVEAVLNAADNLSLFLKENV